jgi:hypothetical protein
MTMSLLNHTCNRIKINAITILYNFFVDVDMRERNIKNILLKNKNNFEKYFNKLNTVENLEADVIEKKNCILYELERLQNMCE